MVSMASEAGDGARWGAGHVVEARALTRRFGRRRALDGVTFALHGGECLALFGPNGAGKTTLLRVLAGLLKPTGGMASIDGIALPAGAEVRASVGLISHHSLLYDALSALENVEFTARLYGVARPREAAEAALARLRMLERAHSPVRSLSRGMQQRVSIARAVVHDPRVILLDEPYNGLDEVGAVALTSALEELKALGAALILVTHRLAEGLALGTHTAIMRDGRFVRYEPRAGVELATYAAEYREVVGA